MRKKRGQNQGSVYQRSSDGRWVGQVTIQKKHYIKYFSCQGEAETWLRQALLKLGQGIPLGGPQASVLEYFTSWLERITPTLRPKTSVQYEQVVHKHILPVLGHLSMQELKAEQIQELFRMKRQAGYGSRTISLINCLLHHALSDAVVDGILFSNPVKKIPKPRQPYHEQKVLNLDQVKAFLQVCQVTRWEAVFCLAISSGMRAGELLGLRWTDIDWEQDRLQVVRQLQRIPRQGLHFLEPKTASIRRSIILGQEMIMKLLVHRQRQDQERQLAGDRWQENNLVFPTPTGTPLDPHRLLNVYNEFLKKLGCPIAGCMIYAILLPL